MILLYANIVTTNNITKYIENIRQAVETLVSPLSKFCTNKKASEKVLTAKPLKVYVSQIVAITFQIICKKIPSSILIFCSFGGQKHVLNATIREAMQKNAKAAKNNQYGLKHRKCEKNTIRLVPRT